VDAHTTTLRSRRRQQTRAEIVRVAFDLFGRRGFDRVSADAIAAAAGVSRATFFNYFPQKDLLLREIAAARVERLKAILARYTAERPAPAYESLVELILELSAENARIGGHSKKLLLHTFFHQASQGLMLSAREQAIAALAAVIARVPGQRRQAKLVAETLFAVYIATMLEWLMREGASQQWLLDTMRERLLLIRKGVA